MGSQSLPSENGKEGDSALRYAVAISVFSKSKAETEKTVSALLYNELILRIVYTLLLSIERMSNNTPIINAMEMGRQMIQLRTKPART